MAVSPYYNKPNQEGLYQHFKAIANSTDLPVLLYNIQGRTAVNIEISTVLRLSEDCENIVAVKEASGNLPQISEVAAKSMEGFRVYSGDDVLTLPILSVGGIGVVSVAGHVIGADIYKMMETFFKSPIEAVKMHKKMIPVINAVFCTTSPTPIKYALSKKGFASPTYRLPMVPATDEQKAIVDKAMADYGLG
jgi:4-hydroxy-tetrahydrodipicolinate synthase